MEIIQLEDLGPLFRQQTIKPGVGVVVWGHAFVVPEMLGVGPGTLGGGMVKNQIHVFVRNR